MIDLEWLSDRLCAVLRWQVAHPGAQDDPAAPEVPAAGQRVWRLFLALHRARGGGMGPAPITHTEIVSFSSIAGEPIRLWELEIIWALDAAWLKAVQPPAGDGGVSSGGTTPTSSRPMSPALFDALFSPNGV